MNQAEQIDKYKNTIINIAIIIVTLIIAANIYKGKLAQAESLKVKISEEGKKNLELEKIAQAQSRINLYKKLLARRDASSVMSDISNIAKAADVKILSVKPFQKEPNVDYSKDIFEATVNAASYDNLAKFINMIESYNNVYIVEGIEISNQAGDAKKGLVANLRISSVAITNQ